MEYVRERGKEKSLIRPFLRVTQVYMHVYSSIGFASLGYPPLSLSISLQPDRGAKIIESIVGSSAAIIREEFREREFLFFLRQR